MLVKVIKPFPYSPDGMNIVHHAPSEDPDARVEIDARHAVGLAGEGYIDGEPHGLTAISPLRRAELITRLVKAVRARLEDTSDESILEAIARLDRDEKARAEADAQEEGYAEPAAADQAAAAGDPAASAEGQSQGEAPDQSEVAAQVAAAVDIPPTWQALHHTKQVALAKNFDASVKTKAEAVGAIEAEVAKRAAA
jgi:hypothetical protein